MAFKLEVIRGATTYNISAGNVIAIENIDDLGGASVRNLEEQGPSQDGASHIGERLEPRTMTLRLNAVGSTDSALDGYRDTLNAMFKPVRGVPITLKITRDDGEIRQIDCRRTGPLSIPLERMNRPGHLHRAVVQLRAADPTLYDPDEETETFLVPAAEWWLGYETIGTVSVLEHAVAPTQGQAWATSGSVAAGSPWTVIFRSGLETPTASIKEAFEVSDGASGANFQAWTSWGGGYFAQTSSAAGTAAAYMTAGTHDYFLVNNGGTLEVYRDTTLVKTIVGVGNAIQASGNKRWRSDRSNTASTRWAEALPYAAAYNIALDAVQRQALSNAMTAGSAFSKNIAYEGDWDSYPVIEIVGPITNPIITNTGTGDTLDFTGGTVGSADIWTIDTRYGRKSVLSGTTSVVQYLSDDSDLAAFRMVPDPLVTGGTNTISVSGSATTGSTTISLSYFKRYVSF